MDYKPELLKGSIQTIILAVLEGGALHGYAIAREIEKRSEDALAFGEGTIYPALKALEREGFIAGTWEMPASGPARKVYRLTASGVPELSKRRETWHQFAQTIGRVIGGNPVGQHI